MTAQVKSKNKTRSTGRFWSLSTTPAGRVHLPEDPAKKHKRVCTWLRKQTSNLDYGVKWRGSPIHSNTNQEVVAYLHRQRKWLGRITNEKFSRHFDGQDTFYFAGRRGPGETLIMLDIDCHKRGTLNGARALGKKLQDYFANLYTEVSTNGNGIHGYILVEATRETNAALKRLETALSNWLACHSYDVEMVEIKGLAPTITYQDRRVSYKAGTLAKVPREAVSRFDELTGTTTLTLADIDRVIARIEADCSRPGPVESSTKMQIVRKCSVKSPNQKKAAGSISGKHIKTERLGGYEGFAEQLLGKNQIATTDRHKVTVMDVAICLMILRFCSLNMNADGSLPTARIKAFWDTLYQSGEVSRPWHCKRYAAIRNYLSSLGVIEWADETYRMGWGDEKGQAAKWRFTDAFLAELEQVEEERKDEETSFIATLIPSSSFLRPRQTWIDTPNRVECLRLLEMSRQVLLLYDQSA